MELNLKRRGVMIPLKKNNICPQVNENYSGLKGFVLYAFKHQTS
jgi:hypothetical protein